MAPAHFRRRTLRRACRSRDVAANEDLADLSELVLAAAARLARQLNDPAVDEEDLRQEFLIRLHQGMSNHDPALSDRVQFAKVLMKRHRVTQLRKHFSAKRRARPVSLEQPLGGDEDGATLGSTVSADRRLAELGLSRHPDVKSNDLCLEVQAAIETLSAEDQTIVSHLMDSDSIAEAARKAGIARTTFNDRVRKLRGPLQQGGMKEFLE
jgi:DNA-directed RNA polymerase specialized sigma24 family protein